MNSKKRCHCRQEFNVTSLISSGYMPQGKYRFIVKNRRNIAADNFILKKNDFSSLVSWKKEKDSLYEYVFPKIILQNMKRNISKHLPTVLAVGILSWCILARSFSMLLSLGSLSIYIDRRLYFLENFLPDFVSLITYAFTLWICIKKVMNDR